MPNKYILCRPSGGLNDTLFQIYICYKYCVEYNRTLLIDVKYYNFLNASFDTIFIWDEDNVIINIDIVNDIIDDNNLSVYPAILQNRLSTYQAEYDLKYQNLACENHLLQFDLNKEYDENILVHHAWGGGDPLDLVRKLKICDNYKNIILEKYKLVPKPYVSVHIRDTDIHTKIDYRNYYYSNEEKMKHNYIYLATDSIDVLNFFSTKPIKFTCYTNVLPDN